MSKLIVFDVDGTIVNSWPHYVGKVWEYTKAHSLPNPCLDTFKLGYGYPTEHDFWPGLPRPDQEFHLYETFRLVDDHDDGDIPGLFTGVIDTLKKLKAEGYTLSVVTSKPYKPLMQILEHHEIHTEFCAYRTHDDIKGRSEKGKPEPDQLLSVITELGFDISNTVMIGDTCMDIKMANAANVKSIGVTWGNQPEETLREHKATRVLSNGFDEILPAVQAMF